MFKQNRLRSIFGIPYVIGFILLSISVHAQDQTNIQDTPQSTNRATNRATNQPTVQQTISTAPYTYYKQGEYRSAIKRADELISQDEKNISAYAVKGWSYLSLGQWKNALNAGTTAYRYNKNDRRITQIIGEAYYELGEYDNAMIYFNRYLTLAPNGQLAGWVYYFIGLIYTEQDKFYKADIALTTAIDEEKKGISSASSSMVVFFGKDTRNSRKKRKGDRNIQGYIIY